MHHDLTLIVTITMAISSAFVGGFIARKIGLPTLAGYLLAGLAIGPFTPGYVGDTDAISQLAEMGVIFMMFGVGLHFSLKDLWQVRNTAIPGAILQMLISTLLGFGLAQLWGWSVTAGLVLGLSISIASTVVLLRGLTDNDYLNTLHGKVAIGWLVLEDLATVAILVLLPSLVGDSDNAAASIVIAIVKTSLFVAIMMFVGVRGMPWILTLISHTRSRELFILAVLALALGTAFVAAELFGVSLALGAFLAGVVIGESDISHQVDEEVIPFREVFSVLFFVSVGMLVDPSTILDNLDQVIALTLLVIVGKGIITLMMGLLLPAPTRTFTVVAAGLSQIGEFSFIVGQAGVSLDILTQEQYGLILIVSLFSIVANPFLFRAIPGVEAVIQRVPILWRQMERGGPTPEPIQQRMSDHVVIVGYGRVGMHIQRVLKHLGLPFLIVDKDSERVEKIQEEGMKALYGDAANSEVLRYAGLEDARVLVVTVADETGAEVVVAAAHDLAPNLPIIARAAFEEGIPRLAKLGARHIINPELEGGLEIVRHMLITLNYPMWQIQEYVDAVRHDAYETTRPDHAPHPILDQLLRAVRGVEIVWSTVSESSPILGKSIAEANLRATIGASIIALVRDKKVLPNPKSETQFLEGDLVGIIGNAEELEAAEQILNPGSDPRNVIHVPVL
jgi:CPA2 family monovalent cation:H+ antiporter-2